MKNKVVGKRLCGRVQLIFNGFGAFLGVNGLKTLCFGLQTTGWKIFLKKVLKKFGETRLPVLPLRPLSERVVV
jgi:hypothetical protein